MKLCPQSSVVLAVFPARFNRVHFGASCRKFYYDNPVFVVFKKRSDSLGFEVPRRFIDKIHEFLVALQ